MMEYFAGLLRQTGIRIDSDINPEDMFTEPHEGSKTAPIEIDEYITDESQKIKEEDASHPLRAGFKHQAIGDHKESDSQAAAHEHAPLDNIASVTEIEDKAIIEVQHEEAKDKDRAMDSSKSPSKNQPEEINKPAAVGRFPAPAPDTASSPSLPDGEAQGVLRVADLERAKLKEENGVLVLQEVEIPQRRSADEEAIKITRKLISGMEMETLQASFSSLPSTKRKRHQSTHISRKSHGDKGILDEQILSGAKKEIRDWAASQSALTSEDDRSKVAEGMIGQVQSILPKAVLKIHGPIESPYLQRAPAKKADEAGIQQHYHISIGPISVSLEKAKRETRRHQSIALKASEKPSDNMRHSRLSRHYVTLR